MNLIAGVECPSVTCRQHGPAFAWEDPATGVWHMADVVPAEILAAQPKVELERLVRHKFRRMGDRQ